MSEPGRPKFGVIVLTMGNRPDDLNRGLASVLRQRSVDLDVAVVGNGWRPVGLPDRVKAHGLTENLGIPAGRNAGVSLVEGELLFFLDDDACLPEDDILARMAMQFAADPTLGMIQPRVVDADGREAPQALDSTRTRRRPDSQQSRDERLGGRGRDPARCFEFAGGWPEPFWYAHEGIDLAWRVWDGGFHVRYEGNIEVHHPAIQPTRHAEFYRYQARNRVWLARRNLPLPVGVLYVLVWAGVSALRLRSRAALIETLRGYRIGLTEPGGERRPMRWRTIWRMTRAGRPPVI